MNTNYQSEAEAVLNADFIKDKNITDRSAVNVLMKVNMLDRGERETIILADELRAEVLLTDERKGRKIAKQLGINLSGTLRKFSRSTRNFITTYRRTLHSGDEATDRLMQSIIDALNVYI